MFTTNTFLSDLNAMCEGDFFSFYVLEMIGVSFDYSSNCEQAIPFQGCFASFFVFPK
jgi:hypothetical protein